MNDVQKLHDMLAMLLNLVNSRRVVRDAPFWQLNALDTVRQNVTLYLEQLSMASRSHDAALYEKAVCRISGIRKGVADLGIFTNQSDDALTALIDEIDTLATSLCLSAQTA